MSWIDKIENIELKIITGDGSEFTPLWKNAQKSRNMNATAFKFTNIFGSLVKRGEADSLVFPFEIHFVGIDNLDESDRFDEASKDKRPWIVIHPMYGEFICQPININYLNANQNVTIITGELWETIEDTFPDSSIDLRESVLESVELTADLSEENFAEKLGDPDAITISTITNSVNKVIEKFKAAAVTDIDLLNVENTAAQVLTALDDITNSSSTFMNRLAALARTPAKFFDSVKNRINVLDESYQDLKLAVTGLLTRQNKLYFESFAMVIAVAKSESAVIETSEIADEQSIEIEVPPDYETRSDVINIILDINSGLNDFLDTLGDFQTSNDATPESYSPVQSNITAIKDTANKSTGQLSQIAIQAKQERKYTIPDPIGLVVLVHRLLGTITSSEIQNFAANNNITLREWLQINKGREVIYFI